MKALGQEQKSSDRNGRDPMATSANGWMQCMTFMLVTAYRRSEGAGGAIRMVRDYIRWCFADPGLAAAFAKELSPVTEA
jgi:hypothetical protein